MMVSSLSLNDVPSEREFNDFGGLLPICTDSRPHSPDLNRALLSGYDDGLINHLCLTRLVHRPRSHKERVDGYVHLNEVVCFYKHEASGILTQCPLFVQGGATPAGDDVRDTVDDGPLIRMVVAGKDKLHTIGLEQRLEVLLHLLLLPWYPELYAG